MHLLLSGRHVENGVGKESTVRLFEDFTRGDKLNAGAPRQLLDADRAAWVGLTADPIPRYTDATGRLHPMLVFAFVHGMVTSALSVDDREELGISLLTLHRAVHVGTSVHATARVVGKRTDPGRTTGVVWIRVTAQDERGVVMTYVHWFRAPRRFAQSREADLRPTLNDHVPLTDIPVGEFGDPPRAFETGGRFGFEDYRPGERIYHTGVSYLDSADIRRFARWFRMQEPCWHLPGLPEHGAPTAHAMGLAYALAHDGLENRIGLAGIHALRTPNRIPPGATVRAMSHVVECHPINADVGALRSRTYLFIDRMPMADDPPLITNGKRYYDHIALDMDAWELVPTRAAAGIL